MARRIILLAVIWLFSAGTIALIIRLTTHLSRDYLSAIIAGTLAPIFLAAWLADRKRMPTRQILRALFDSFNDCGGLFMAPDEIHLDPAWLKSLPGLNPPRIIWRWLPAAGLLLSAVVFTAFAVFSPIPALGLKSSSPLELKSAVEDLNTRLEQLKEQTIVESNKAVEIKEELTRLEAEATGEEPAKAWEALDAVKASVVEAAKDALEKNMAAAQTISEAMSMNDMALDLQQSNSDQELLTDVKRELGSMINTPELSTLLAGQFPPGFLDSAANGHLTAEQLKMLTAMLKTCNVKCQNNLLKLANLKWVSGDFKLGNGQCSGSCTNALLALLAAGNSGCDSTGNGLPGRGGISRGRGDAPITWQNETSEAGAGFKEQALPSALSLDPKNSLHMGFSRASPAAPVNKQPVSSGALIAGEADGDSREQTVLPRHRGAIRKFFDRADKPE